MFAGKSVLVTGGTGSFGREFIRMILRRHPDVARVIIYSRDEMKQFEMAEDATFSGRKLRYFIGDVRDKERLYRAMEGVEIVVHAAALKQVPVAEYNPFEAIKTNVLGAQNVIECSLDQGVRRVVALSTDKACAPINLYGATKLCADKLFQAANNFKGSREIRFSTVRYGNVMGSRASVIPVFLARREQGVLPVTHPEMTRFNTTLRHGAELVLMALERMWGGEIFIPKIPSCRVLDIAEAVSPSCRIEIIGVRPGEKLHEELITATDALAAVEFEDHYVLLPSMPIWDVERFVAEQGGRRCAQGFSYNSGTNHEWLDVAAIRRLIVEHIDPDFAPT